MTASRAALGATVTRAGDGARERSSRNVVSGRGVSTRVRRAVVARAASGKKISQNEFTQRAWEAIVAAPEVAKQNNQQIVETEHSCEAACAQKDSLRDADIGPGWGEGSEEGVDEDA